MCPPQAPDPERAGDRVRPLAAAHPRDACGAATATTAGCRRESRRRRRRIRTRSRTSHPGLRQRTPAFVKQRARAMRRLATSMSVQRGSEPGRQWNQASAVARLGSHRCPFDDRAAHSQMRCRLVEDEVAPARADRLGAVMPGTGVAIKRREAEPVQRGPRRNARASPSRLSLKPAHCCPPVLPPSGAQLALEVRGAAGRHAPASYAGKRRVSWGATPPAPLRGGCRDLAGAQDCRPVVRTRRGGQNAAIEVPPPRRPATCGRPSASSI
jgi:hypothetical protein